MPGRVGHQDRRGFDAWMQGSMVSMVVGILLLVAYSWKVGLPVFMISAGCLIALEAASAPPVNGPRRFVLFFQAQTKRYPILVCLGDSLTHGNLSATYTPDIPRVLAKKLGMEPPSLTASFAPPVWVVNCAQNGITSHTIRYERMQGAMNYCSPDYVLLFIGTNDVRAMYSAAMAKTVVKVNQLPTTPSLENYEANITAIIDYIQTKSMQTQIGVCTLPPMGEDLSAPANDWVRKANTVIEKVVNRCNEKCTLVPIYERFESVLEKKSNKKAGISVDSFLPAMMMMGVLYHLLPGLVSWNSLSKPLGHVVLSDALHLNENGKDIVVDTVVEWLMKNNVAKAIAVKSM